MIGWVVAGLALLAACDGAFAGFRSSVGRTGLVEHRAEDVRAQLRGLAVLAVLLTPSVALALSDGALGDDGSGWLAAGRAMLLVYAPYGVLTLLALAAYATLHWRRRFLAMSLILGPFTLLRPGVALLGGALGVGAADGLLPRVAVVLAVVAVLAVGPVCDRWWYRREAVLSG